MFGLCINKMFINSDSFLSASKLAYFISSVWCSSAAEKGQLVVDDDDKEEEEGVEEWEDEEDEEEDDNEDTGGVDALGNSGFNSANFPCSFPGPEGVLRTFGEQRVG